MRSRAVGGGGAPLCEYAWGFIYEGFFWLQMKRACRHAQIFNLLVGGGGVRAMLAMVGGGGEVRGRGLEATWSKVMAAAFKSDRLKVHYVVSVGKVLIRRERSPLTAYTNSPHVLYWINRPTVKDNTISYCFALFVFGGPHHISSFWLIFLWEQLVYSVMGGKKNNKYLTSLIL